MRSPHTVTINTPSPQTIMLLVGCHGTFVPDSEESLQFFGQAFGRLIAEVRHLSPITRYVGFQSPREDGPVTHYLGVEVKRIDSIPTGMVGWELGDESLTTWVTRNGSDSLDSRQDIRWLWHAPAASHWIGEFALRDTDTTYQISALSYVGVGMTGASDEVEIVEYDPEWPAQFERFSGWLCERLGSVALRVEHFGSTSIPGLPAKPIIDILVEVPSLREAKQHVLSTLAGHDWEYWWYAGHMTLVKRARFMGVRTHHVHIFQQGDDVLGRLAFRNYLRGNPGQASEYAALKRKMAMQHRTDRERYTRAKADFINRVTREALAAAM